ncbi:uncharacterized protein LOC135338046 isoform X2 [Halichondria panicea]|uniref:uncharacterized protein LOC135338046 isoform X2 n=1 Tax=Halichondria panicea TaxID=6063 RepID=UPI00312B30DD
MDKLKKELWRLRLNWFFVILVSPLFALSTTGISSSFHQFVTNPRAESLHGNQTHTKMEPGLGESELFYSLLISGFNLGSVIGGIANGLLSKCVPQWYLWMVMLLAHTSGYLIYALASNGWLIMLSKILSGYFLGADLTLGFSYLSVTSVQYIEVQKERGVKVGDKSAFKLRNTLFAINGIAFSIGYFIGPGAAVIFAQFQSINQFRVIGWYNAAWGVALLILLVVMFRGESGCSKPVTCCTGSHGDWRKLLNCTSKPIRVFIVITMLILPMVEIARFGVLETLFNPILSDSFGFDERNASYIFLAFGLPHIAGSILLYILEKLKMSTQLITFVALLLSVAGYMLLGDWQSIPYDPCTEYSPFHHPEIVWNNYHDSTAMFLNSTLQTSAGIQSLRVFSNHSYSIARDQCMTANITGHVCHWIPSSIILKTECEDCPAICRSLNQILTFPQFLLGLGLLLLSNSLLWVSLVALLFNQLPEELQGIIMGIRSALNGFVRTVAPLIFDAAYEGALKRTFPIMAVLAALHLPFFVEILVLYRQLGPMTQQEKIKVDKDNEYSETEALLYQ